MKNLEIIFDDFKLKDLRYFFLAMKEIGINLIDYPKFFLTTEIRNLVLSKNKILISIAPSKNFWIKSEKMTIGNKNYDKRMNHYTYIFYNWPFIRKFYDRIANHPRCLLGYVSSMQSKNLKPCIETISLEIKNFCNFLMFDQGCHDELKVKKKVDTNNTNKKEKFKKPVWKPETKKAPEFRRNQDKIIAVSKRIGVEINETNFLVLESEEEKSSMIKSNIVKLLVMEDNFFEKTKEEIEEMEKRHEHIFQWLVTLLDTCDDDIREYIIQNPPNFN
jgi:hypothetical protein